MGRLLFVFLLVAGLGAAVVGVQNRQLTNSKAQQLTCAGSVVTVCYDSAEDSCVQTSASGNRWICEAPKTKCQTFNCFLKGTRCIYEEWVKNSCAVVNNGTACNASNNGAPLTGDCGPATSMPLPGGGGGTQPGTQPPPPGYQACGSCSCASIGLGERGNECQINDRGVCVWNPGYCAPGGGGGTTAPKKVCGETCSVNTDCANAATPGVSVICRAGFCENAECPAGQTVYGANCTCGSNSRLCGQTCGATVGLCAEGACTYTAGSACSVGASTHCAGTLNGYQRLSCVDRDQGNNYLKGPSGKTFGFTDAEIKASCSTAASVNCPVGGTTGRVSTAGGKCTVNSDCRAPSGGGTAVCRSGYCENSACPVGKTLPGAAYLCAGQSYETQQCGQPCYLGALCSPGQGICRYVNTGGNNCPWGWQQTYCVGTANGFAHSQCAAGDTGGAYLVAPGNKTTGISLGEMQNSCQVCGDGVVQTGEECDDGIANGTTASICGNTCKVTNCLVPSAPTPAPVSSTAPSTSCPTQFGAADGYNLFVLGNLNHTGTDTEGKVAVGGNAVITKYNLGSKLSNASGGLTSLVVGGNLNMTETIVFNGSATYGGTATITASQFVNGSAKKAAPAFSFTTAGSTLNATSSTWAGFTTNGTTNTVGDLTFTGTNANTNVFKVAGSQLATARKVRITAPASSTVLINVSGSNVTVFGHQFILTGVTTNRIIYNFYEATTLKIDKTSVLGSVFAPKADLAFTAGRVDGVVIVKSLGGNGQINNGQINQHIFNGCPTQPGSTGSVATPVASTPAGGTGGVCIAPTLKSPTVQCASSASAKGTITWGWFPVSSANQYEVDIFRTDWSVAVDNGYQSQTAFNCSSGQCAYTTSLAPGGYRLRLRSKGTSCTDSAYSRTDLITLNVCGQ